MYYNTCSDCGSHLDPGEECDCIEQRRLRKKLRSRYYKNIFEYMKEMEELQDGNIVRVNG